MRKSYLQGVQATATHHHAVSIEGSESEAITRLATSTGHHKASVGGWGVVGAVTPLAITTSHCMASVEG